MRVNVKKENGYSIHTIKLDKYKTTTMNIIFRKDPDQEAKTAEYIEEFATPYKAAERGYADMVIEPKETRPRIITALNALASKREIGPTKKHGNIPL